MSEDQLNAMWDVLSKTKVEMFALPGQTLGLHVTKHAVLPDHLYVKLKSSAALSALESALREFPMERGKKATVSPVKDMYVVKVETDVDSLV